VIGLDLSLVGIWLLVLGAVAIAVEGALMAWWSLGLTRRARRVQDRLMEQRGRLEAEVESLRLALAEMQILWQPYGGLLRWLRHPIAIALLQSYVRRRAAAR
jgi:hypothetical protein